MAVTVNSALAGPYLTNGATTVFPFDFKVIAGEELSVFVRDSDGVDTVLSADLYDVSVLAQGGSITFPYAPVAGKELYVVARPSPLQDIAFARGSPWLPDVVNEVNDRGALRDQALRRDVRRGLAMRLGEEGYTVPPPAARAGKVLGFAEVSGDPTVFDPRLFGGQGGGGWTVYPSGDKTGNSDSAHIKAGLESGTLRPFPGTYYLRKTVFANPFATITGKSGIVDWGGSTIVLVNNPLLDLGTGATNPTMGQWFAVIGCTDYGWVNYTIRHDPDPTAEVEITAITGTQLTCRALPGRFPAFPYAGGFGWMPDPKTGGFKGWGHLRVKGTNEPAAKITPRPDLGTDMLTIDLPQGSSTITSVTLQNGLGVDDVRMVVTVANSTGFQFGQNVTVAGVTGLTSGGVSVVNGKTFAIGFDALDEEDPDDPTRQSALVLTSPLANAERIFPDNTTPWVSDGTITTVAPIYFAVGGVLQISSGKKRGGHFLLVGNKGNTVFKGRTESCTGIGYYGRDNEDMTFEIEGGGKGNLSFNHGASIMMQTWGKLCIPRYVAKGTGDAHWACNSMPITGILSSTTNSVTVDRWGSATRMDNRTPAPRAGQEWGYLQPDGDLNPLRNIVTGVSGLTCTFRDPHPAGYTPTTWKLFAIGANREVEIGEFYAAGSWTVGMTMFFQRVKIGNLFISGCNLEAIRVSNPGTFWNSRFLGGGHPGCKTTIMNCVIENSGYSNRSYRLGTISGRRLNSSNLVATAGSNPLIEIGYLSIDRYGFAALNAAGINIKVGVLHIKNGGEWRNNLDLNMGGKLPMSSDPGSKVDVFSVSGSNVSIGSVLFGDNPTFYSENGGTYTPPAGLPSAPVRGTAVGGETTLAAPVPVPAGMEWMVRVFIGGVEQDPGVGYTANGTPTLTLAGPLLAGEQWRVQRA